MEREGDEDIKGGLRKLLDTQKGGSEKTRAGGELQKFVCFKRKRRGGSYKTEPLARGATKISSFPPHPPPPCHKNELSLMRRA